MSVGASDCIFCKIIAGEIPAHRVLENEHVLAFLDVNPLAPGHTLVVPKSHAGRLEDLTADQCAELARVIGPLARRILAAASSRDYNILQNNGAAAGQVVGHVHVHIIPRRPNDGLGYRWNAETGDAERLANLAAQIRQ